MNIKKMLSDPQFTTRLKNLDVDTLSDKVVNYVQDVLAQDESSSGMLSVEKLKMVSVMTVHMRDWMDGFLSKRKMTKHPDVAMFVDARKKLADMTNAEKSIGNQIEGIMQQLQIAQFDAKKLKEKLQSLNQKEVRTPEFDGKWSASYDYLKLKSEIHVIGGEVDDDVDDENRHSGTYPISQNQKDGSFVFRWSTQKSKGEFFSVGRVGDAVKWQAKDLRKIVWKKINSDGCEYDGMWKILYEDRNGVPMQSESNVTVRNGAFSVFGSNFQISNDSKSFFRLRSRAHIETLQQEVRQDVSRVEPLLRQAMEDLNCVSKAEFSSLKQLHQPPATVQSVLDAVLTLLGEKSNLSWDAMGKILGSSDFFSRLRHFNPATVTPKILSNLQEFEKKFNSPEVLAHSGATVKGLAMWLHKVLQISMFRQVAKPKEELIGRLEKEWAAAPTEEETHVLLTNQEIQAILTAEEDAISSAEVEIAKQLTGPVESAEAALKVVLSSGELIAMLKTSSAEANPPPVEVRYILDVIGLLLMGPLDVPGAVETKKANGKAAGLMMTDSWYSHGQALLTPDPQTLFQSLLEFTTTDEEKPQKEMMNEETSELLLPYLWSSKLTSENIRQVCGDSSHVEELMSWVRSLSIYSQIARVVAPKREKLRAARIELDKKREKKEAKWDGHEGKVLRWKRFCDQGVDPTLLNEMGLEEPCEDCPPESVFGSQQGSSHLEIAVHAMFSVAMKRDFSWYWKQWFGEENSLWIMEQSMEQQKESLGGEEKGKSAEKDGGESHKATATTNSEGEKEVSPPSMASADDSTGRENFQKFCQEIGVGRHLGKESFNIALNHIIEKRQLPRSQKENANSIPRIGDGKMNPKKTFCFGYNLDEESVKNAVLFVVEKFENRSAKTLEIFMADEEKTTKEQEYRKYLAEEKEKRKRAKEERRRKKAKEKVSMKKCAKTAPPKKMITAKKMAAESEDSQASSSCSSDAEGSEGVGVLPAHMCFPGIQVRSALVKDEKVIPAHWMPKEAATEGLEAPRTFFTAESLLEHLQSCLRWRTVAGMDSHFYYEMSLPDDIPPGNGSEAISPSPMANTKGDGVVGKKRGLILVRMAAGYQSQEDKDCNLGLQMIHSLLDNYRKQQQSFTAAGTTSSSSSVNVADSRLTQLFTDKEEFLQNSLLLYELDPFSMKTATQLAEMQSKSLCGGQQRAAASKPQQQISSPSSVTTVKRGGLLSASTSGNKKSKESLAHSTAQEVELLFKKQVIRHSRSLKIDSSGLSSEEITMMRGHFEQCDVDQSGECEKSDFIAFFLQYGSLSLSKKELEDCFSEIDEDGGGSITFDEFIKAYEHIAVFDLTKKDPMKHAQRRAAVLAATKNLGNKKWQYEKSRGKWFDHSDEHQKILDAAFAANPKGSVTLKIRTITTTKEEDFLVDFSRMTQRCLSKPWFREIRVKPPTPDKH